METIIVLKEGEVQSGIPFDPYGNRIVCAANRAPDGSVIIGVRHFDMIMHEQIIMRTAPGTQVKFEQGFVDKFGNFHDREAAWRIAVKAGQVIRRCGGDDKNGGTLYSENLY